MRIELKITDKKTLFQIDPDNAQNGARFTPCIFVAVYKQGQAFGETKPIVISTISGTMAADKAGLYAKGLSLASYVCSSAEQRGLSAVFHALKNATNRRVDKTLFSISTHNFEIR